MSDILIQERQQIIPKKIFQTWHTKDLPPKMKECVDDLKRKHPDFEYFLFDENECLEFIQNNFNETLVYAFETFIPSAYKADLWRYCVLYIHGGFYLDVKLNTTTTLHQFLDKEYYVRDLPTFGTKGIYNAFMVCKAGNPILLQAINQIVENVKNQYYGNNPLHVSGPELLLNYFSEDDVENLDLYLELDSDNSCKIMNKGECLLKMYKEYFDERNTSQKNIHYSHLWKQRTIYTINETA